MDETRADGRGSQRPTPAEEPRASDTAATGAALDEIRQELADIRREMARIAEALETLADCFVAEREL
ncbi:MAG: hypothetical protein Kow00120_11150 [Anaerolineae bacterium]